MPSTLTVHCRRRQFSALRPLLICFILVGIALTAPALAAEKVELSVDASKTGFLIDF